MKTYKRAQFRRAEKGDEGMALKICTKAEDMPNGKFRLFVFLDFSWTTPYKLNMDSVLAFFFDTHSFIPGL